MPWTSGNEAPAVKWPAIHRSPWGRNDAWQCPAIVGARLVVRHCGHPTAIRPYYFPDLPELGKFSRLNYAQACAEALLCHPKRPLL
jgi:hypothetical protein